MSTAVAMTEAEATAEVLKYDALRLEPPQALREAFLSFLPEECFERTAGGGMRPVRHVRQMLRQSK